MIDACRGRRADRYSNGSAINATAIYNLWHTGATVLSSP